MAFEDRSSPNTATSPCTSDCGGSNLNTPNSPESSRTSPFTCMTIGNGQDCRSFSPASEPSSPKVVPKIEHPERSFFRITSFALPSPKRECDRDSPVSYRSPSPIDSVASSVSPPPSNEPVIQTLKYSIRNILQPDFGKTAVLKTKKPTTKISFRPYEKNILSEQQQQQQQKRLFGVAPLGSLCQAVSQIGSTNSTSISSAGTSGTNIIAKTLPNRPVKSPSLLNSDDVKKDDNVPKLWPAWVYCTRYSDRPSSGPRSRRIKKPPTAKTAEDKRPRTAFSSAQLAKLKAEFNENRYLTESRRQKLSAELGLNEAQIKIWFQNKRAKIKKSSGQKNPLALQLMAQGLYNHSTVPCDEDDMPLTA